MIAPALVRPPQDRSSVFWGVAGTHFGMKTRRLGAIGGCEARTQGALVATLRARLRTQYRAAERGQAVECFVLKGVPNKGGCGRGPQDSTHSTDSDRGRRILQPAASGERGAGLRPAGALPGQEGER